MSTKIAKGSYPLGRTGAICTLDHCGKNLVSEMRENGTIALICSTHGDVKTVSDEAVKRRSRLEALKNEPDPVTKPPEKVIIYIAPVVKKQEEEAEEAEEEKSDCNCECKPCWGGTYHCLNKRRKCFHKPYNSQT